MSGADAVFGTAIQTTGLAMALVLGVFNPANQEQVGVEQPYEQRYCDAEDPGAGDGAKDGPADAAVMTTVYVYAIVYTMVAGWIFVDNLKLLLKFYVGAKLVAKAHGHDDIHLTMLTPATADDSL